MCFTTAEFALETLMELRPMGVGTVTEYQSYTTVCQRKKCGAFRLERVDRKQIKKSQHNAWPFPAEEISNPFLTKEKFFLFVTWILIPLFILSNATKSMGLHTMTIPNVTNGIKTLPGGF